MLKPNARHRPLLRVLQCFNLTNQFRYLRTHWSLLPPPTPAHSIGLHIDGCELSQPSTIPTRRTTLGADWGGPRHEIPRGRGATGWESSSLLAPQADNRRPAIQTKIDSTASSSGPNQARERSLLLPKGEANGRHKAPYPMMSEMAQIAGPSPNRPFDGAPTV